MYLDSLGLTDVEILYKKWLKRQSKIKKFGGREGLNKLINGVISEERQIKSSY